MGRVSIIYPIRFKVQGYVDDVITTIDQKLTWNNHVEETLSKATVVGLDVVNQK